MSPRSNRKTSTWSAVYFKKTLDLEELSTWARDTGQRIPCFDRCQLIITWMSNTKEVHSKPRLHVSLSTCYLEYGSHLARLHRHRRRRPRRRRRRAYAPTSNTASHDNHQKTGAHYPWVSFCFPYMGLHMGLCLAALRAAGAPLENGPLIKTSSLIKHKFS